MPYTVDEVKKMMQKKNLQDLDAYNKRLDSIRAAAKERDRIKEGVSARRKSNQNEPTMNTENQSSGNVSTYLNGNSNQASTPYAAKKQTQKTDQVQIPYLKSLQKGSADTESLLSKASQSDYKMSKSEQKQVREYAKKWLNDYSKGIRDGSISTQQAMKDTTDANSEYGKMVQLYNKSSSGTAFASGLIESALKLPGMFALGKKIDDMGNGTYRQYDNITKTVEDAKTQHPFAEGAGNMVGEMAKYQAANAVMSGIQVVQKAKDAVSGAVASIPFLSAGGNAVAAEVAGNQIPKLIGNSTANILSDLTLDTVFDTIPYLHDTKQDGETAGQTAGKALKRTGYNLGLNIAGEAIPYLVSGAGKTVKNMLDSSADDIADAGREAVDMSSSAKNIENGAETATDALKQADSSVEQIPELKYDFSQPQSVKQVENILTDSKAKREFQQKSGIELKGTKSEQRQQIKDFYAQKSETNSLENIMQESYNANKKGGTLDAGSLGRNAVDTGSGSTRERNVERLKQIRGENGSGMESGRSLGLLDSNDVQGFRVVPESQRKALTDLGITNNEFRDMSNNPELFSFALESGKMSNPHGVMVDSHSAEDLVESGALTFLAKDNLAGGAVMPDGNITAVFKNPKSKSKRAATDIIIQSLENGGDRLDCYGEGLVKMYAQEGFEPVAKVKFNPEYAPEGWDYEALGEPYIYVMAHNGDSVDDVIKKMNTSSYRTFSQAELDALPEMEYDDAIAYRNQILDERYSSENRTNLMRASDAAETASKVHSPSVEVGPVPTAAEAASGLTNNSIPISNERVNVSGTNNADYEGLPFTTPEADNARIPELGKPTSTGSSKSVNPDGTYVSRTATNTLRNSELVKSVEGAMDDLEKGIKNGDFNIEPMTEKESIQRAADALDKDYAGELRRLSTETWTNGSRDVDEGMIILENKLKDAAASGNFDEARAWMRKVVEQGSEKGKGLQAYAKYSRTAEGSLVKAQNLVDKQIEQWAKKNTLDAMASKDLADNLVKEVDYLMESRKLDPLNPVSLEEIQKAVGNIVSRNRLSHDIDEDTITKLSEMLMKGTTAKDIEKSVDSLMAIGQYGISDETIEQVQNIFAQAAKYGENSKARVDLENKAYALLANEVTSSSWSDKWDAWRYFSMLSSPTTHIRNMIGNTAMNAVTNVKDALGAVMESAVDKVSKNGISRTKAMLNPLSEADNALLEAAGNDAVESVYRQLSGSKYSATAGIEAQAKAFRGEVGSKFQKLLDANSNLLEKEDWLGLKKKYRQSLAGFLKANGADSSIFSATDDASKALLNRGRAYAINQAQEATFHETSKFAQNLTEFSQNLKTSGTVSGGLAHAAIESVMPFKKTPVNILKQGIEYSPIGIVKGIGSSVQEVKKGSKTASEAIEQMAKGLTGTGLLSLGAYLSSTGLLRGNGTGDADQDKFDELQGAQNYALQIGDKSYTLDWMAPSILPVLVGAELQKAFSNGSDASDILNALGGIADPIIETSFMTGVSNALDAVQYADDGETLQTAGANMLMGYAQQGVPTALGKVARTIDNTRRSSLTDSTGMAGQIEYNANKVKGKIPFLSQDRPAYVDAWGRTQENLKGGNTLTNALYQFVSPGYYSQKNTTSADEKLQELYDSTGDASVLPTRISRSYDGKRLTAREYEKAQTIAGQKGYEMISGITEAEGYADLPDADKAEAVNAMYGLAKDIALSETVGKEMSSTNKKLYQIYQDGGPEMVAYYYMYNNVKKSDDASKSKNLQAAMDQSDMSREEKQQLYSYLNPTTKQKNNPYTESNQKIAQARTKIQSAYDVGISESQTYSSMSGVMRDEFDKKMDTFLDDYAAYNIGKKKLSSTNQKYKKIYEDLGADGLARYYVYKKNADFNGNGHLTKDELTVYIDAQPMLSAYDRRLWFSYLSKAKNPY